jgi:hypothetical protein
LRIAKDGATIVSLEDWLRHAPPKRGRRNWKPGKAAFELARAWCDERPQVPAELTQLLASADVFEALAIDTASPLREIYFDGRDNTPCVADIALEASMGTSKVVIVVEATAGEKFDRRVSRILSSAAKRIASDKASTDISRLQELANALLPPWRDGLPHLGTLRYGLVKGIAGTLAMARDEGASAAIFVVHEFVDPRRMSKGCEARNAGDLNALLRRLTGGEVEEIAPGGLIGPLKLPGTAHLYLGSNGSSESIENLYVGRCQRIARNDPPIAHGSIPEPAGHEEVESAR